MFFDVVSVLEGQPYNEAMAYWAADWDAQPHASDVTPHTAFSQLDRSGLVVRDHFGRLTVPNGFLVGRSFLSSQEKATQYGFTVGNRVWLQQDGRLPAALANALQVNVS
jgi:hypothetical protein